MSNTTYVKNYNIGNISLDVPRKSFIYQLPLLSFKDVQHTVNLSMVFNYRMYRDGEDVYGISKGFKLSLEKRLIFTSAFPSHIQEAAGNKVWLEKQSDDLYTFDDDSRRILRRNIAPLSGGENLPIDLYEYTVEYPDGSKEKYDDAGKIVGVYDKYDSYTPYLTYTYTGGLLTEIAYRTTKKLLLSYTGGRLSTVSYMVSGSTKYSVGLTCLSSGSVTAAFSSGVDFSIVHSEQTDVGEATGSFAVTSRNRGETAVKESLICSIYDKDIYDYSAVVDNGLNITATYTVGNEIVDVNSYEILRAVGMGEYNYALYSTNKHGATRKTVYTYRAPAYSHEGNVTESSFFGDEYTGSVERYNVANDVNGKNPFLVQSIVDGDHMGYLDGSAPCWSYDANNKVEGENNYYILSGWVRNGANTSINDFNAPELTVSSNSGDPYIFKVPLFKNREWTYFTYLFYNNAAVLNVWVSGTGQATGYYESRDFRITAVPMRITPYNGTGEVNISDDRLRHRTSGLSLSLTDAVFKKGGVPIEGNVYAGDLLRFFTNYNKNIHSGEFYTDNCKNIIPISGTAAITVNYEDNDYPITAFDIINVKGLRGHIITTEYIFNNVNSSDVLLTASVLDKSLAAPNSVQIAMQEYDGHMDMIRSQSNGVTTVYTRTGKGLVTSERVTADGLDITRSMVYDSGLTKLVSSTDEFGNTTTYTTDGTWGTVTVVTAGGQTVSNTYDSDMSAITEIAFSDDSSGRKTLFEYENGFLSELIHGGVSYQYGYDGLYLTSVSKNNVSVETHAYTETNGNTTVTSNYGSYTDTQVYDKYGRLVSVNGVLANTYDIKPIYTKPESGPATFSTIGKDNDSGRLASTADQLTGIKHQYGYNENGAISGVLSVNASTSSVVSDESYKYDNADRLTEDVLTVGSNTFGSYYGYLKNDTDPMADGRLASCVYKVNGTTVCDTDVSYDDAGRMSEKHHVLSGGMTFKKQFEYDGTRVDQVTDKYQNTTLHTALYTYDALGRIATETKNGATKQYIYDIYGQLTQEIDNALDKKTVYVYNINGCLTSVTTSKRDGTNASTKTFTYDTTHPDRLVNYNGTAIPYDSYGYPTSYNGWTLTWSRGRLTRMSKGTKQTGQETYSYTYNAFGQRTKKTYSYLNTSAGFQPVYQGMVISSTTVYEYDNSGRLVRETVNERHFEGTTSGRTLVYLYDASSMIGVRVSTESTTDTYYYNRNLQGDVTEIYTANGVLKVKYTYDAFGNCTVSGTDTNLGNINPIRYRGYYFDKETGFYHLGARYYNPEWRRFISPDKTAYIDPETPNGLNLYCYCGNDLVNYKQNSVPFNDLSISMSEFAGISKESGIFNSVLVNGSFRNGLFFGKGTVTGLYASGHTRAQISLKKGKFVLGAFGKISLLNATGQIGIGNDDLNVSLVGIGDIGTVSVMAGILIDPSKTTYFAGIEAKASVFTARGGIQFEIFDTQIEVGGSVSALSAGFQFGIGIKDGEFYYNSGFAVLFGYDFYIRVKIA